MKKHKAAKVILIISFAPTLLCALWGVIAAATEFFSSFNVINCFECFFAVVAFLFYDLWIVGVIPVCIVIQIACIIWISGASEDISAKKYIPVTGVIALIVLGAMLLSLYAPDIRKHAVTKREQKAAELMYSNAEEKIVINDELVSEGIYVKECVYDNLLIDYDDMKLGFLIEAYLPEYSEAELLPVTEYDPALLNVKEEHFVQAIIPLSSPGRQLITFSPNDGLSNRTCAAILETEDGLFFAENIIDRNNSNVYNRIYRTDWFVGEKLKYCDLEI